MTWTTSRHNKPPALNLRKADVRAAIIIKALSKGLGDGGDGSDSKCTFAFVLQTVLKKKAATEWELEALLDHFHALIASKPMNECEVIAGRAYTGPLYVKMNGSLRKASKKFGEQAHLKCNSYTNLIYACNSLLRKFSEISIIPPGRKVVGALRPLVQVRALPSVFCCQKHVRCFWQRLVLFLCCPSINRRGRWPERGPHTPLRLSF